MPVVLAIAGIVVGIVAGVVAGGVACLIARVMVQVVARFGVRGIARVVVRLVAVHILGAFVMVLVESGRVGSWCYGQEPTHCGVILRAGVSSVGRTRALVGRLSRGPDVEVSDAGALQGILDGCHGDLQEEFRIVGQRLHEITWVNPFPLGDSRHAALYTKLRAWANISLWTYLNSDYYKLLVNELAAMQATAEVEAHQQEVPLRLSQRQCFTGCSYAIQGSHWTKIALYGQYGLCWLVGVGSYLLSGMNDMDLEKLGWRGVMGHTTWDVCGKNTMGCPTLWDKLRWDGPYNFFFSVV
ncbi:hypothetical protein B0H14DRAFT_2605751 [Mycena olivaceomarginata]|nr:hypothetical protein B0H14DRAFT_2605751 [Mycena olivaceomarginata]